MGLLMTALILMNEEKVDLAKTTGIEWHKGIDAAKDQGRPILLFQLLGNFDEKFC